MFKYALYNCKGPVAIRYPRGIETLQPEIVIDDNFYEDVKNPLIPEKLLSGDDITLIAEGSMVYRAFEVCKMLNSKGYHADLFDIKKITPLDSKLIIDSIKKTRKVITLENSLINNGIGMMIENIVIENNISAQMKKIGVKSHLLCHGSIEELYVLQEMDSASIYKKSIDLINSPS